MIYDNEEYDEEQTNKDTKSIVYTFLFVLTVILLIVIGVGYLFLK